MSQVKRMLERISELEKSYQELKSLVYKISHKLTPRIWKLENPGKNPEYIDDSKSNYSLKG